MEADRDTKRPWSGPLGDFSSDESTGTGFAPQTVAAPNPTTALAQTLLFPEGSTYGVDHTYRVIGTLNTTVSPMSNERRLLTDWPAVDSPTLTGSSNGPLYTVTPSVITCPAGTSAEYRQRMMSNETAWQAWSPWSTTRPVQHSFIEGEKADFEAEARCVYSPTQASPPSDPGIADWVQPIVTSPKPPTVTFPNPSIATPETTPVPYTYTTTGCPTETYPEYRTRTRVNGGAFSAWSAWTTNPAASKSMWQGEQFLVEAAARCISPWTKGPDVEQPEGPWVLPIQAPTSPNVGHDAGGTSGPKDDRLIWSGAGCPTATSVQYLREYTEQGVQTIRNPNWDAGTSWNIGTTYGRNYEGYVRARCVSAYTVSPPSGAGGTYWETPVPQSGSIGLSLSADVVYTDTSFTVYLSSSCASGTAPRYQVAPNGGTVYGSFNTSHSTTGTRTYSASVVCYSPVTGRTGPARGPVYDSIRVDAPPPPPAPPAAGTPGGPIAVDIGLGRGCTYPFAPRQGQGLRLNALDGACYYQTYFPEIDAAGQPTGENTPWEPALPGRSAPGSFTG